MTNPLYKSKRWIKKRERILRRDEYLCQQSKRYGRSEQATTVHHIYQIEYYPELAFEDWNLISLTERQHNSMHDRVTHELTALGMEWQRRREREFREWSERNGRTR